MSSRVFLSWACWSRNGVSSSSTVGLWGRASWCFNIPNQESCQWFLGALWPLKEKLQACRTSPARWCPGVSAGQSSLVARGVWGCELLHLGFRKLISNHAVLHSRIEVAVGVWSSLSRSYMDWILCQLAHVRHIDQISISPARYVVYPTSVPKLRQIEEVLPLVLMSLWLSESKAWAHGPIIYKWLYGTVIYHWLKMLRIYIHAR